MRTLRRRPGRARRPGREEKARVATQKCMHSVVATSVNFVQRVIPLAAAGQIEKHTFYASLLQEVAHIVGEVVTLL